MLRFFPTFSLEHLRPKCGGQPQFCKKLAPQAANFGSEQLRPENWKGQRRHQTRRHRQASPIRASVKRKQSPQVPNCKTASVKCASKVLRSMFSASISPPCRSFALSGLTSDWNRFDGSKIPSHASAMFINSHHVPLIESRRLHATVGAWLLCASWGPQPGSRLEADPSSPCELTNSQSRRVASSSLHSSW